MKTQSKTKIEMAQELFNLIEQRKLIEKQESELKEYFKGEIKDGVLEAGSIVISIEKRSRASLDKKALEAAFGSMDKFERVTDYSQVSVRSRA